MRGEAANVLFNSITSDYDSDDEISKENLNILISILSFYIIQHYIL